MSVTKTARLIDQPLAIDKMPTSEVLWQLVKRPQVKVWLLSVYSLATTYVLVRPTIEHILRFFGV